MTRQDFLIKWGVYALALLPVWFLELYVLNRFPVFGVTPMLLPLAAICVAVLEGAVAGGGFGLAVGILCDAVYFNTDGTMTIGICVLGILAGGVAQYALRQDLVGCLLCSFVGLVLMDLGRMVVRLLAWQTPVSAMLAVAVPEVLWSMVFVPPVYLLFRWVYRRVPKKTVL